MGFFAWFHRRTTVEKRLDAVEQACKRLYLQRRVTLEALTNLQGQIVQLERQLPRKKTRHAR